MVFCVLLFKPLHLCLWLFSASRRAQRLPFSNVKYEPPSGTGLWEMGIREPERRVIHLLMAKTLWIHRGCSFPKSPLWGTVTPHTDWRTMSCPDLS